MPFRRANQLQHTEGPHNSFRSRLRAALVYTYIAKRAALTRTPLFTAINYAKGTNFVSRTVRCNIIIRYKTQIWTFSKFLFWFLIFLMSFKFSDPRIHLHEDSCLCSYVTVRFACITISSLAGVRFYDVEDIKIKILI